MSAGHAHSRPNEKHPVELKKIEADPDFQRMWNRPFKVVTTFQVPDSAGYSVMGEDYFIDADLYRAVMAGTWTHPQTGKVYSLRVQNLTQEQIIQCLLEHERTEKCILDADNPINLYEDAHEFATLAEHTKVKSFGARPVDYERALASLIAWNQIKPLINVPPNLSCAPLLDNPDAQDKATLKVLKGLGIADASKISKKSVQYSPATDDDRCSTCAGWMSANRQAELSPCHKIDGAVRDTYWCTKYQEAKDGQTQGGNAQQNPVVGVRPTGQPQVPDAGSQPRGQRQGASDSASQGGQPVSSFGSQDSGQGQPQTGPVAPAPAAPSQPQAPPAPPQQSAAPSPAPPPQAVPPAPFPTPPMGPPAPPGESDNLQMVARLFAEAMRSISSQITQAVTAQNERPITVNVSIPDTPKKKTRKTVKTRRDENGNLSADVTEEDE